MYLASSQKQASSVKEAASQRDGSFVSLYQAIDQFDQSTILKGQAYDAARSFSKEVFLPLIQGSYLLEQAIVEATEQFPQTYIAEVDSQDLKESELLENIQKVDQLIGRYSELKSSEGSQEKPNQDKIKNLTNSIEVWSAVKAELEKKLQKLRDFDTSSPSLFHSISEIQVALQAGFSLVDQSWNASSKTYQLPANADLSWRRTIQTLWAKNKAARKELTRQTQTYDKNRPGFYGGDQGSPSKLYENGTTQQKKDLEEIIRKYYPKMTHDEIIDYLAKLDSEGCGYVALVNTVFKEYEGRPEEFEEKFGFSMYREDHGQKVLNFDYLVVDLYAATDNHNEGWGFTDKFPFVWGDQIDPKEDPSAKEGIGTNADSREYRFEKFMKDHGITVDARKGEATIDYYKEVSSKGQCILSIYGPIVLHGVPGQTTDYPMESGGHAITVTGVTEDGKFIVSSWGKEYIVDPNEGPEKKLQVIEYE